MDNRFENRLFFLISGRNTGFISLRLPLLRIVFKALKFLCSLVPNSDKKLPYNWRNNTNDVPSVPKTKNGRNVQANWVPTKAYSTNQNRKILIRVSIPSVSSFVIDCIP